MANPGPAIVPDQPNDNADSVFDEDTTSSTQSITSSILDYRRENGRTYHKYKDGKYALPNDDTENERLDLQNHIFLLTFDNKLGLAPPNEPEHKAKRVLDLGTGTGIWALDYADEHPESEVIGIDLSPIQPQFVPPNVQFVIDDIDEDWNYAAPFDYIHSRMMNMSIQDWKGYLKRIFDNLEPGGYAELQEADAVMKCDDGTLKKSHKLHEWNRLLNEGCTVMGRTMVHLEQLKDCMVELGFVDIVDTYFKWPLNQWPRDEKNKALGLWNNINTGFALEGAALAPFTRSLGWSREEVSVFVAGARKELNDQSIHAYWPIISIYGRKPTD